MTRIVSGFIFYIIYSIMYLIPVLILFIIYEYLLIKFPGYFEEQETMRQFVGLIFLAYAMCLPGYRAKLASEAYGDRDMGLWEAHSVSGVILKTHLSFLPVIGFLFKQQKEDVSVKDSPTKIIDEKNRFDKQFDK